ncbi:hypothetical protein ACLKA6_009094 [Drosophila palustris]
MVQSNKPNNGRAKDTETRTHASTGNNNGNNSENNFDKSFKSLNAEQVLDGLFHVLHKLWLQGRRVVDLVMSELGGNELLDAVTTWCVQHPDIAICVLAASLVFLLPLLIIFGFGIATMVITFTGILVLEGTLLTVVVMIFLACIASLAVAVAVFAVVAYFGFSQISGFLGMDRHRDSFIKFMQQNRTTQNNETSQDTNK